jgi:hypothetical protein
MASASGPPALSAAERSAIARGLVAEENDIRNQVFTWFLTLNGFLFAALAFAWSSAPDLVYVLAALGALASLSWTAHTVVQRLAIARVRDGADVGDPAAGMTSATLRSMGLPYSLLPYLYPWRFLPPLLGAAWIAVVVVRIAT